MLTYIVVALCVISAAVLILLVLLHSGRGGGLSDMFGGGLNSTAAGSTVVERNLNRITIVVALVFVFTAVALGIRLQ
jgi:preprotein translocase subunit SecG